MAEQQEEQMVALSDVLMVLGDVRRAHVRVSVRPASRTPRENAISEVLSEASGRMASLGGPLMEPEQYDRRRMATILCAHLHGSGHHPTFCEQAWDAVVKMTTPEGTGE